MSKTHIYCHIVFGTKNRERILFSDKKKDIYKYIWGIIKKKKSTLIRINGGEDHIHILLDLHPSVALAEMVRDIKTSSSHWIQETRKLIYFDGWGREYYASSVSPSDVEACKQYIISQEKHHKVQKYETEIKNLAQKWGMNWYEDDLI